MKYTYDDLATSYRIEECAGRDPDRFVNNLTYGAAGRAEIDVVGRYYRMGDAELDVQQPIATDRIHVWRSGTVDTMPLVGRCLQAITDPRFSD